MTYLVDANVLSEATKPEPDAGVVAWLRANEAELAVDPVIVGEIYFGILLMKGGKRRRALERWFETGVKRLECLSWEKSTGIRWAQLLAKLRLSGESMPIKDSLIAATALDNDLHVVTRNRRHFESAGLTVVDPFSV